MITGVIVETVTLRKYLRRTEQSQFTHTYPAYLPSARQKEMNIRKVKVGLAVKQLKDILKKKKKKKKKNM